MKTTFDFEYNLKEVHIDFSGTVEAYRPTFNWGSENYVRSSRIVYDTLKIIFELDVKLFWIYNEANYGKKAPVDSRYMSELDWKEYRFLFGYRVEAKRGYSVRRLRLKTKAEDLIGRRLALKSNLLFLMLTHSDRYVKFWLEGTVMRLLICVDE